MTQTMTLTATSIDQREVEVYFNTFNIGYWHIDLFTSEWVSDKLASSEKNNC